MTVHFYRCLLAVLGLFTFPAYAFLVTTNSSGTEIKWAGNSVSFWINSASAPAGTDAALQSAMNTWSTVSGADFQFVYDGSTSLSGAIRNSKNVCSFGDLGTDGTIARNSFWYSSSSGAMLESDIVFNTNYSWSVLDEAGKMDVQNIATHELGHSLSLADLYNSGDSEKTMYGYASLGQTKKRTLEADDIAGIIYLYPSSVSEPTVTLSLSGSSMTEAGGAATVTATLSAVYMQDVTVNLAFSGTATVSNDYIRSGTNVVIAAGSLTNSITLTAVDDTLYEGSETVIVDVSSVVNGTESGTQQKTVTITDDDSELGIFPLSGVSFTGSTNGVTSPVNQVYVLTNAGSGTLTWKASSANSWIILSATNGTLTAGAAASVTVSVNASSLAEGSYSGSVMFSNTTRAIGSSRPVSLMVTPPYVYFFPLDTDPDPRWARTGEWAFGHPTGSGGTQGFPDPSAGATGTNVFGVNLDGDYSVKLGGPYYLEAGPFDFSGYTNVILHFQRWLNTDAGICVPATIDISTNGKVWISIYTNNFYTASVSTNWSRQTNNISSVADRQATVYIRWGYQLTNGGGDPFAYSGWNIDDIGFLGTAVSVPDADGDGISDSWEIQYFNGTNTAADADSDGDGFSNLQEYIAGSNPTNSQSFFSVSSFDLPSGGAVIRWNAVTGRVYGVHWTTNLLNSFLPLETNIVSPQSSYTDTVHGTELHNFYEIKVRLNP